MRTRPKACTALSDALSRRVLFVVAAAGLALACALAIWMGGAGTALAPEPARVNGDLYGSGWSTSANYVYSNATTTALWWSGSWTVSSIPVGTPCTTTAVSAGTTVTKVIQGYGGYRRCA